MLGYAATTNFVITLGSLGFGSARQSTPINAMVGGTGYDDYMIELSLGTLSPTTSGDKAVYIWFYGSADGTNYDAQAVGSDSAITIGTNHNLKGPFTCAVVVGTLQYNICIPSVASYFGGVIPNKWGIVVENQAGGSLNGTESNFLKWFTPVFATT